MKKILIANWKANLNTKQAIYWMNTVRDYLLNFSAITDGENADILSRHIQDMTELVVAPSFPQLEAVARLAREVNIALAVQDISQYECGSYTGEVAVELIQDYFTKYVLVGHSERRRLFNETDQQVALKMKQIWQSGLTPVLCLDEPNFNSQHQALFDLGVDQKQLSECVIAFEPVAAIGTGQPLNEELVANYLQQLKILYQPRQLIYGGSVSAENLMQYLAICDGALIGKASLDPNSYLELLKAFSI